MSDAPSRWTTDLLLAGVVVVAIGATLVGTELTGPVRWLLAIPFLLFLPGYAVVSAIFPDQPPPAATASTVSPTSRPGWTVRLVLSVVLSGMLVAIIGVVIDRLVAVTIRLAPVVTAVTVATLAGLVIALARRQRLPAVQRARPLSSGMIVAGQNRLGVVGSGGRRQTAVLVVSILLLVGSVGFIAAVPSSGDSYTETYLLSETGGELSVETYPETFTAGEGESLYFGLENNEHRAVSYEVVVVADAIGDDGEVAIQQQVDRFTVDLEDGDGRIMERQIAPTLTGEPIRLRFLVFKDGTTASGTLDRSDADLTTQLWIDVV